MTEGCGLTCMKYLLFVFNFIIWLGGLGLLALGIILYFGIEDWIPIEELAMMLDNDLLRSSSYILIGAGALVFLLAFCGCCGAIMESKCLLVLYFLVLLVVFCAQLGAGILASIYSNEIEDAVKDELIDSFARTYGNKSGDQEVTDAWRIAESILDCCGYSGGANYNKDQADGKPYSLYKVFTERQDANFPNFPESCCVGATDDKYDADNVPECKNSFDPTDKRDDTSINNNKNLEFYHGQGCSDRVEDLVEEYIIWIGAGAIGVACVELFCMLFAICLCRNVDDTE